VKNRKPVKNKKCPDCKIAKCIDKFALCRSRCDGHGAYCLECNRKKSRKRYEDSRPSDWKRRKHLGTGRACKILGRSLPYVRKLLQTGKLKATKINKWYWDIKKKDLLKCVKKYKRVKK